MKEHQHFPSIDRLSVIVATILLAYAFTTFINFPIQQINLQLPGFLFSIKINFTTVISIVVSILATAGVDWLTAEHPLFEPRSRYQHWLIPAFTALVIGVPLNALDVTPSWWAIFGLGGVLLVIVLISEYISVDPSDVSFAIARISLTAVSMALLLVLFIAVRGAGLRLYIVAAAIFPAVMLVSIKTLHLRLHGWNITWSVGISIAIFQIAIGLFYLPIKPLTFGLILLGITYALVILAVNIEEKHPLERIWIEPAILLAIFSTLAVFLR